MVKKQWISLVLNVVKYIATALLGYIGGNAIV